MECFFLSVSANKSIVFAKTNKQGLELIYKIIDSTEVPAKALDLGDNPLASIWFQHLAMRND